MKRGSANKIPSASLPRLCYTSFMNEKAFHTLEYDKILERLESCAATQAAKARIRALLPMNSIDDIRRAQTETSDARDRISRCGSTSFGGIRDVIGSLRRLEVGSSLGIPELLAISSLLDAASRLRAYGRRDETSEPDSLDALFSCIEPLSPLNSEIKRCIISEEEIADDASPGLRQVRRSIRLAGERIHSQLSSLLVSASSYLQDNVITMRDGRYCLPVRAEYRSQVPGLIHDQSGSGSTFFVEPMSVVKLNNELKELSIQEQKEIEKVLAGLSVQASEYISAIETDYRALTELDFIFAKAAFSAGYRGIAPRFNDGRRIRIKKARHPLLDQKKVVPIDVELGGDFSLLVITGPNTGGKTVTLKTIGLLTLMGEAGLHIPAAEGSELAVFDRVFADIGDEQSIEQSLSTFSAHMTNIVRILDEADECSLVLFDELGAGTDPTEGAALAISILSRLHRQGTRTVATTHYSELKLYALSTDGVENACCEFDVATLRPTYRLLIGVPGKSNAFEISSKLGLPDEVIDEARAAIGVQDEAFEDVISDLESKRRNMEEQEAQAAALRNEIEKLKSDLASKQERLDAQRERILREAKEEARGILQEAKDSADRAIRTMNKAGVRVSREAEAERSSLRQRIDALDGDLGLKAARRSKGLRPADLHIGDGVKVLSLNLNGTVSTLPDAKGNLFVQMGVLRSQVNVSDLELIPDEDDSSAGRISGAGKVAIAKASTVSPEINLVGMRVDEAMAELDKYLDDAYLARLESVRIIHGRGTGALKSAVQTMLRKNRHIDRYRGGEFNEGGYGVTIATFK